MCACVNRLRAAYTHCASPLRIHYGNIVCSEIFPIVSEISDGEALLPPRGYSFKLFNQTRVLVLIGSHNNNNNNNLYCNT